MCSEFEMCLWDWREMVGNRAKLKNVNVRRFLETLNIDHYINVLQGYSEFNEEIGYFVQN